MRVHAAHSIRGFRTVTACVAVALAFAPGACDSATDPDEGSEQEAVEPRIIFAANTAEQTEGGLFSVRPDGEEIEFIGGRVVADLAVSPDGRRIAYGSYGGFDEGYDVYVFDLQTGEERRLTTGGNWNLEPTWSPDGSRLAFTAQRSGVFGVSVMNADGTGERRISGSESAEAAAWSSGGNRLAYSTTEYPNQRVVVADVDGEGRRTVADGWAWSLDWSEDDAYLLALGPADRNGNRGVIRLASDGSDALSLTPASTGEHRLARWSPDGSRILYSTYDDVAGRYRLYLIDAGGTGRREVPVPEGFTGAADWLDPHRLAPDRENDFTVQTEEEVAYPAPKAPRLIPMVALRKE